MTTLTLATARERFAAAMRSQGWRRLVLGLNGFELLDAYGGRWPCSYRLSTYACALSMINVDFGEPIFADEAKARQSEALTPGNTKGRKASGRSSVQKSTDEQKPANRATDDAAAQAGASTRLTRQAKAIDVDSARLRAWAGAGI